MSSSPTFIFLCACFRILMMFVESWMHKTAECGPRCTARCSNTQYKKPCLFFCQKCCAKCLCVPPGTYGNKQVCPCYNNWKTKRGGPKCPWNYKFYLLSLLINALLVATSTPCIYICTHQIEIKYLNFNLIMLVFVCFHN